MKQLVNGIHAEDAGALLKAADSLKYPDFLTVV